MVSSVEDIPASYSDEKFKKVNLLIDTPLTESSTEEMIEGRLIMETVVNEEEQKAEIYRQLLLRGDRGILDQNSSYVLISNAGERILLRVFLQPI